MTSSSYRSRRPQFRFDVGFVLPSRGLEIGWHRSADWPTSWASCVLRSSDWRLLLLLGCWLHYVFGKLYPFRRSVFATTLPHHLPDDLDRWLTWLLIEIPFRYCSGYSVFPNFNMTFSAYTQPEFRCNRRVPVRSLLTISSFRCPSSIFIADGAR